jgi:hypothetical protein
MALFNADQAVVEMLPFVFLTFQKIWRDGDIKIKV